MPHPTPLNGTGRTPELLIHVTDHETYYVASLDTDNHTYEGIGDTFRECLYDLADEFSLDN